MKSAPVSGTSALPKKFAKGLGAAEEVLYISVPS